MFQSVEPSASSPEPTSEPVAVDHEADRDQFFEACDTVDTTITDGTGSDVEDTDSEASFHSLTEELEQCGLEDLGAEAAFAAPADKCAGGESSVTESRSDQYSRGGGESKRGGGAGKLEQNMSPSSEEATLEDVLQPRLSEDQETLRDRGHEALDTTTGKDSQVEESVLKDRRQGHSEADQGADALEVHTSKVDFDKSCEPCTSSINESEGNSGSLGEGLQVDDIAILLEDFDICCLQSVKAIDEETELKVKDRDTGLSEEELNAHTASAVSEKRKGNVLFTAGLLTDAILRYNEGLKLCPLASAQDRAMLYHNRGVAYDKMAERKLAVDSLTRALGLDPLYCKALARRAGLHEALDSLDEALADYKALLELDPGHHLARAAVQRLPPIIEERNEKLKAEMLGKLKDFGNVLLRPFGLSTENFQVQQDPSTGGYNVNFQEN